MVANGKYKITYFSYVTVTYKFASQRESVIKNFVIEILNRQQSYVSVSAVYLLYPIISEKFQHRHGNNIPSKAIR